MKLKEIREMYPEGTQIVLTEMAGESQMPYGLKGTVKFVDDAGQIHMSWENGSSLALNINEDTFEKVEAPEKISVILVEPGRYPKLIEIEDYYPFSQRRENRFDERGQIYRCGGRPYHQGRNCPKEKVQSYRKGTLL